MTAGFLLTVLTGFLGSGKTTLLRDFLAGPEAAEAAVIVNEVGEIGLDDAILGEAGGPFATATLANGCVCCRPGDDLSATVEALLRAERPAGAPPLARIVLETSGLAKPGPVLRSLASLAPHRPRLSVVATYDAARGAALADEPEAAAQWAGAHRLVATKVDRLPAHLLPALAEALAAVNPLAEAVATADRAEAVARAFAPPPRLAVPSVAPTGGAAVDAAARTSVLLLRQSRPAPFEDLAAWLDNLAGALGERLLRLKGLVAVEGDARPWLLESVGATFSAPRPFSGPAPDGPFLVLIARDLDGAVLDAVEPRVPLHVASWTTPRPWSPPPRLPRLRAEAV